MKMAQNGQNEPEPAISIYYNKPAVWIDKQIFQREQRIWPMHYASTFRVFSTV